MPNQDTHGFCYKLFHFLSRRQCIAPLFDVRRSRHPRRKGTCSWEGKAWCFGSRRHEPLPLHGKRDRHTHAFTCTHVCTQGERKHSRDILTECLADYSTDCFGAHVSGAKPEGSTEPPRVVCLELSPRFSIPDHLLFDGVTCGFTRK